MGVRKERTKQMKFTSGRSAAKLDLFVLASLYRRYSSRIDLHPSDGHVSAVAREKG